MSERFLLIGHPVAHSLSPAIHGAAYEALGRAGRYELVDAPDEAAVAALVERLRSGDVQGANVTVPWKRLALSLADRVDESARDVGAANVLARAPDGAVVAYNTDAPGLARELAELVDELGGWGKASGACVLGNGGAALGAVVACRLAGAKRILVTARAFRATEDPLSWSRAAALRRLGAELLPWPEPREGGGQGVQLAPEQLDGIQLVVQATSAGMHGADPGEGIGHLVPWTQVPRLAAYDLVYNPEQTPFLRRAVEAGHLARGGLGMLVRQAALAIEIWWGTLPPLPPLRRAAAHALAARAAKEPGDAGR